MEPRRRNPLRRYPTAVCISVLHFGLTQSKTRALNSPVFKLRSDDKEISQRKAEAVWHKILEKTLSAKDLQKLQPDD